jgi:hypothetical protein
MVTAQVTADFDAPAERVWEFVRWENMERYVAAGMFARVVYDERRAIAGATRSLFLHEGPPVRERLETIEADAYHYVYRLIDCGPMPVTDYVGDVRITPTGSCGCRLTVTSTCEPVGVSEAEWVGMYTALQNQLFDHIRAGTS